MSDLARRLGPVELRRRCDPTRLGFATTTELADLDGFLGQERASSALELATGLRAHDYNVFALGPAGFGKHALTAKVLEEHAAKMPVPSDWCYVHNFSDRSRPRALSLAAGRGSELKRDMETLLDDVRAALKRELESDEYRARTKAIEEAEDQRREKALEDVRHEAEAAGIAILGVPSGMAVAVVRDGKVLGTDAFTELPEDEKERYKASMERVGGLLEAVLKQGPRWHRESRAALRELTRRATARAVHPLADELRDRFADLTAVARYIDDVEADILENAERFLEETDEHSSNEKNPLEHGLATFRRYRVNVVVDNGAANAAPVIYEDHPTHPNLFGRLEHFQVLGALLTDFNLLKAGAVQRANGGYLILDAIKLLRQPYSWEALKRALRARQARIEAPMEELGFASTISLTPEPIPLDLKVVLVGERIVYYLLSALDPDFKELFKIAADFEEDVPWSDEALGLHSRLIATIARREKVRPLDAAAVARVVEESARVAEDREKLALDLQHLSDLVRESDQRAARDGSPTISGGHVREAIDARIRRSDRIRDVVHDDIRCGVLLVDTKGTKVGQVNGLSLVQFGEFKFARPTRITVRAHFGRGDVVDIEREVELGGPIHSKGVLILEGFLAARYAAEMPLALAATLVFEQSYGGVEGDSASLAELCALLSAIGEVPLKQSFAVTGSVNQHGMVQPVGSVNEKVEGFFDVCRIEGLTGDQGVIIPRRNVRSLMLREDVVEAVAGGRFHVFAAETVDEALESLTDMPAGERGLDGCFTEGSVNAAVETRLSILAEMARAFEMTVEPGADDGRRARHVILGDRMRLRRARRAGGRDREPPAQDSRDAA